MGEKVQVTYVAYREETTGVLPLAQDTVRGL